MKQIVQNFRTVSMEIFFGKTKEGRDYDQYYYWLFNLILYSFLGWVIEMIYHAALGIFEDRGFLFGPFCLIYGVSVLLMIFLFPRVKAKNKCIEAIIFWIYIFFLCTIIEYVTSYLLEVILNIKLWDYTGFSYNINGRVRLIASVTWASASLLIMHIVQPFILKQFNKLKRIKNNRLFIILRIFLWLLCIDFVLATIRYCLQ